MSTVKVKPLTWHKNARKEYVDNTYTYAIKLWGDGLWYVFSNLTSNLYFDDDFTTLEEAQETCWEHHRDTILSRIEIEP